MVLQFAFIATYVIFVFILISIRKELRKFDLNETKILFLYAVSLVSFWVSDVILWDVVIARFNALKIAIFCYVVMKFCLGTLFVFPPLMYLLYFDFRKCCCRRRMKKDREEKQNANGNGDREEKKAVKTLQINSMPVQPELIIINDTPRSSLTQSFLSKREFEFEPNEEEGQEMRTEINVGIVATDKEEKRREQEKFLGTSTSESNEPFER